MGKISQTRVEVFMPVMPTCNKVLYSFGVWLSFQTECLSTLQTHISVIFGSTDRHIMPSFLNLHVTDCVQIILLHISR